VIPSQVGLSGCLPRGAGSVTWRSAHRSPRLVFEATQAFEELRCPGNPARADARTSPSSRAALDSRHGDPPFPHLRSSFRPAFLLACLAYLSVGRWEVPASAPDPSPARPPAPRASALGALTFTAVETGIESGAGIWAYLFLTAGRGLPPAAAGVAVAAYWAMMCAGRVVLGPVAERLGPARVLAVAVAGVPLGAALMMLPIPGPGPGALAVAGLMLLGLAAALIFPLFTLTTGTTRMVSLQVAASAVGGAAVPAGLGLLLGAVGPRFLAPSLLALGLAMGGLYAFIRPA
jgi:hypothetical protein